MSQNKIRKNHEQTKKKLTLDQTVKYQITVPGKLVNGWKDWYEGLEIADGTQEDGTSITTLTCTVDQAALQGLLRRLYTKGLPLLSVICIEANDEKLP